MSVCFGAVVYVRRRWVHKVYTGVGVYGHWTYWAAVRDFEGVHHVMVSKRYFEMLIRRGAKRRRDCQRHPGGVGPKAPTKVVAL